MSELPRRQKRGYFHADAGAPTSLIVRVKHRIHFSDVDPMGVLWHGRYAQLFEQASEELGRATGLSYSDFDRQRVAAPIVQIHIDYFSPLRLGEQAGITGKMIWNDAARINIEYAIHQESGALAAAGYTVQMFVDETGTPLLACPPILETCQQRWRAGEFGGLQ